MPASFSPSRIPSNSRLPLGSGMSRLKSSFSKKPPEPLRRAVADCLSSTAPHHGSLPSNAASDALRILRDYLASPATIDMAYIIIIDHTLAERERSPAVVARCVALLKRYLFRYKPSEDAMQQIYRFCLNTIAECDNGLNRRLSPWSRSLNQQSGVSSPSTNVIPPLPVSSYASETLVKSLNYICSMVDPHIPKRSFQQKSFVGAHLVASQPLPTLSSLLDRSFKSQLSPVDSERSAVDKVASPFPVSNIPSIERVDGIEDCEYIALDVLKWRLLGQQQSSFASIESDPVLNSYNISGHNFVEIGAAASLVESKEAKMNGQDWKHSGTAGVRDLDQVFQPSCATTTSNSAFVGPHLRAITASKRCKLGPNQVWEDSFVSTFRPQARQLFQYRHYSEQQPLHLNSAEVCEVIAAVCSETSSRNANLISLSSRLSKNSGKPVMDVAVSVLIKLIIDMYVLDCGTAAPLTLYMLEEMINSPKSTSTRARAFDLILNLGVHAHLLEPIMVDNASTFDDYSQELYFGSESPFTSKHQGKTVFVNMDESSSIDKFELWILAILYENLLLLVQIEEKEESVWASAFSCLLYFVCGRGKIRRSRLKGLDIRIIKALLEISRENCWAEAVHCKLICLFTNMFYEIANDSTKNSLSTVTFLVGQFDLIGGVEFVLREYSLSNSRQDRQNLYIVLFDYILHHINETCIATGVSEYTDAEIQPIATLLTLADAPEAFYISVKLGVDGIGDFLRRSISMALYRYPNTERLSMLLEKITGRLDTIISSFTHLDTEFSHMLVMTKSYKHFINMEDGLLERRVGVEAKHSWATLHFLLHSDRFPNRQNAYTWLGDLFIAEFSEGRDKSVWSKIQNLQQQISIAGVQEISTAPDIPLAVWLLCGLLKSKDNAIRWGFLIVLERLLMHFKFLIDENELLHHNSTEEVQNVPQENRLDKAIDVIDIMSSALSLVAQNNETDPMIILKMCDILFSQLCLKVLPASVLSLGDVLQHAKVSGFSGESRKSSSVGTTSVAASEKIADRFGYANDGLILETAAMAASLLQGQAIVPIPLVSRVPTALFYWPLIQLAGAVTDNVSLGIAVGSKGRGNLPGATSDIRATLLLLLIGKCTNDFVAFQDVGGEEFFRELLDDTDSRVAYYSAAFLLRRMMNEEPEKYQRMLQNLVFKAQQSNNEKLLENPYLQMRGILQLLNDLGTGL